MKSKVYARFRDNIWAADLAEMGSLSLFNCGFKYLFKRVLLEESAKSFSSNLGNESIVSGF